MKRFYVGLPMPSAAKHFARSFISVNRLRKRKSPFEVNEWVMDSGAFTEVSTYGGYRSTVAEYATEIRRWVGNGNLVAVVAQDWMCEPHILKRTGLTVKKHQELTVERYDELMLEDVGAYVMPVLQGYHPYDYVAHLKMYGDRFKKGALVGVGSVCKRNANPTSVLAVLVAILDARPDLRLHGFGIKVTALKHAGVRRLLYSSDSMAWCFAARKEGRNANDWREAKPFEEFVTSIMERPDAPYARPIWMV